MALTLVPLRLFEFLEKKVILFLAIDLHTDKAEQSVQLS
jgi:hypothetical protein